MVDGNRISIADIRAAGHCVKGVREWFERHDLDFRGFLKDGIEEEEFVSKGDHLAAQVVSHKKNQKVRDG